MWSELPTQLRTVLGAALILVVGVAVASFTLSFIALREVASSPITGWGHNAWIFPLCVDLALLASEVVLVGVSMIKGVNRAVPFVFMVLFGALTVWFNVVRVPASWRLVTAVPPVAGIFMTLLIAFLMKVLAQVMGKPIVYHAPPPEWGMLSPRRDALQGAIYRPDWGPQGPSTDVGPNGQGGHEIEVSENGDGTTKRAIVEAYLDQVSPRDLNSLTAREVAQDLTAQGHPMTIQTVSPVLRRYRSPQKGRTRKR
jgi:Protein of unknown function (DUF2637)